MYPAASVNHRNRSSPVLLPSKRWMRSERRFLIPAGLKTSWRIAFFEKEIYRCLPQMDTIDRIIIRCMVERDVTERQLAALISKAIGEPYSHQAVHKRIPVAAKRLAKLMDYVPFE